MVGATRLFILRDRYGVFDGGKRAVSFISRTKTISEPTEATARAWGGPLKKDPSQLTGSEYWLLSLPVAQRRVFDREH